MTREAVLVIDFGTSSVRSSAVDIENGAFLAFHAKKYPMLSRESGYAELDPEEMWQASQECLSRTLERMPEDVNLNAVTFSYFGDNIIPVDKDGTPLSHLMLSFDIRGQEESKSQLALAFTDEEFVRITGGSCPIYATGGKILWWKNNRPALFEKTAYYFTNQQYINWKLGLEPLNDYAMACRKCMLDIERLEWSKPILDYIGIEASQLGNIAAADQSIGTIRRYGDVALPKPLPVILGGHDCVAGLVGVGVGYTQEHTVGDIASSYENIGFIAEGFFNARRTHPQSSINSNTGPYRNTTICTGAYPSSGAALSWVMREIMGGEESERYEKLWEKAYFDGSNSVVMSPGFFRGEGGFLSLDLSKTKQDIFHSTIEALTFEGKRIVDEYGAILEGVDCVRIGGGTARAEKWLQLRADCWNCRVERMENIEISSLGAAMIAAVRLGAYTDIRAASQQMVKVRDVFLPRKDVMERYASQYQRYQEKTEEFRKACGSKGFEKMK